MDMDHTECGHGAGVQPATSYRLRITIFLVAVVLIVGLSLWLARPFSSDLHGAHQIVSISMAGFTPDVIHIPAGQEVTLRIDNPDSRFHAAGAGMHQFAVEELGIDARIEPESSLLVTIPATEAGTYTFYCDICCGGKASPSMLGTLVVG